MIDMATYQRVHPCLSIV